jgi:hypothetical protein
MKGPRKNKKKLLPDYQPNRFGGQQNGAKTCKHLDMVCLSLPVAMIQKYSLTLSGPLRPESTPFP